MQAKEKIVECAKWLFHRNGYKSTSLKKIIDESGIQKGGIYYYFSDKETLGIDVIEKAGYEFIKFLNKASNGKTAFEKIVNQFAAILEYHKRNECRLGCIFGNSALEMSNQSERMRITIDGLFGKWKKLLKNLLKEAAGEGSLRDEFSKVTDEKNALEDTSEKLAVTIVAAIEGGIMLSKTGRDYHHLENVLNSIILFICK